MKIIYHFLKANNIFDGTSELNYIIDDIQKELWSDDILSYYRKDISFSEFAKIDAFHNILSSLTTIKIKIKKK